MSTGSQVRSIEAIESFRASLIIYKTKAIAALDGINSDLLRLRLWLETDQRLHWENQLRQRTRKLEDAQQALLSAELSNLRTTHILEKMAVQKAKTALNEAEEKFNQVRKWNREFNKRTEPITRQLQKLDTFFAKDLVQAIAYLNGIVEFLGKYRDIRAPSIFKETTPNDNKPPLPSDSNPPLSAKKTSAN